MMTFDGWDARICGDAMALPQGPISDDVLMHFRTRGSKNGVRRYQQTDGTWTPLGLKMRKEREGWGESRKERRAEKRVQKAERRAAKAQKKIARQETRRERMAKRNANDLKNLSDNELRQKIARAKMELEYKELTRSPVLKAGINAVGKIMEAREKKEERALQKDQMRVDMAKAEAEKIRAKADVVKNKGDVIRSVQQTKQERWRYKTKKRDVKEGQLWRERKAQTLLAKKELKEAGIINRMHKTHTEKRLANIRTSEEVNKGMATVAAMIKGKKAIDKYNNPVRSSNIMSALAPRKKKGGDRLTYDSEAERNYREQVLKTRQAEANAKKTQAEAERAKYQAKAAKNSKKNKNKGNK